MITSAGTIQAMHRVFSDLILPRHAASVPLVAAIAIVKPIKYNEKPMKKDKLRQVRIVHSRDGLIPKMILLNLPNFQSLKIPNRSAEILLVPIEYFQIIIRSSLGKTSLTSKN